MKPSASRARPTVAAMLAGLLAGLLLRPPAHAEYMQPDLHDVPIERLIANLAAQVKQNPKKIELLLNLARTHAMAYASKAQVARWAMLLPALRTASISLRCPDRL